MDSDLKWIFDDIEYARRYPCVGCGFCCLTAMCYAGVEAADGMFDRCPYLVFESGRYWCDLYRQKGVEIYAGAGCTSSLNTWRKQVKYRG